MRDPDDFEEDEEEPDDAHTFDDESDGAAREEPAEARSRKKRPVTSFARKEAVRHCACCDEGLPAKRIGLCNSCRKLVAAAMSSATQPTIPSLRLCLAYCRKCSTMQPIEARNRKHPLDLVKQARNTKDGFIGIIVYDADIGCPSCLEERGDSPHGMISRIQDPTRDVA